MEKTFAILGSTLFCCVLLLTSCFNQKSQMIIYDGEVEWPSNTLVNVMVGSTPEGVPAMWCPILQAQVGNSFRTMGFSVFTCEEGTYSAVYDAASQKWSNPVIGNVSLNVDYDGMAYPTWYGQSATVTIHRFDKKAKRLDATLQAVVMKEGTTETRNIRVDVKNLNVKGK